MTGEEAFAFARTAIDDRLIAMGIEPGRHSPRERRKGDADGIAGITSVFTGRDPAGHAHECEIDVLLREDVDQLLLSIESRMAPQQRNALRVDNHPPVRPGPDMRLGHLRVFAPFARRLRIDHGCAAQDVLRHAMQVFLKGAGRKLKKHPRPYGLAMDANRVDHREELGAGAYLKGRNLVLHATMLPEQLLGGIVGQPVTRIVQHPLLDDGMTIARAFSERSSQSKGGGVTVLAMEGEWIPGDRV